MRLSVKKIIEFITVAIAAIGVMILLTSLTKYHYRNRKECLRCSVTESYEIPYHVWIQWNGEYKCSGTVIHDKHILTLADCVTESVTNDEYKTKLKVFALSRTLNHGKSYDVEKIILHPSGDKKSKVKPIIALIQLTEEVLDYKGYIVAIPLSEKRAMSHVGLELFVTGYGRVTGNHRFFDFDQHKFHMEIVSMARCKKLFSDVDSGKFCAVAASGYKPCMSDRGSPATDNKTHLIGIYLNFEECLEHYAELFIDVTSYSDFIKSAITAA